MSQGRLQKKITNVTFRDSVPQHGTHDSVRTARFRYYHHKNDVAIKISHLKSGDINAILVANNEHTIISPACCGNIHRFKINRNTGKTDIDNRSDTTVFGNNFCYLRWKNETCSVDPFFDEYDTATNIELCSGAIEWK